MELKVAIQAKDKWRYIMNELQELLGNVLPGTIHDANGLDRLLAACWDDFIGANDGGMGGHKLLGRMESVEWRPPILSFVIECHGMTACGSTRAEMQHWELDLDQETARITKTDHRQLRPKGAPVDIELIKSEIVQKILAGENDSRLQWVERGVVRILLARIFPCGTGCKRAVEGRRKRLRDALRVELGFHRWVYQGRNVFHLFVPSSAPRQFYTCCPESSCSSFRDGLSLLHSFGIEPSIKVDERGHYFEYTVPKAWALDERRRFHTAIAKKIASNQPPCGNCADVMYSRAWTVECNVCKKEFVLCEECVLMPVKLCGCSGEIISADPLEDVSDGMDKGDG